LDEASAVAVEAVDAARASGDDEALVLARGREFLVLVRAGRMEEAEAALAEAARLSVGVDRRLRATVLSWRAYHAAIAGALSDRVSAYVELAEAYEALGDVRRMAGARANLADVYNRLGAFEAAAEALESAITDCRRVGNRTMEGYSLANLAHAKVGMGDARGALDSLQEAERIAEDTSEVSLLVTVAVYRASALSTLGRHVEAAREAEGAAKDALARGIRDLEMLALAIAAEAHLAAGATDEALDRSKRALDHYDALGAVEEGEAEVFHARVQALRAAGRDEEAERVRQRAEARLSQVIDAIEDDELRRTFSSIPVVARLVRG
jgi:tetratricopeptide (TPR) repeat protein